MEGWNGYHKRNWNIEKKISSWMINILRKFNIIQAITFFIFFLSLIVSSGLFRGIQHVNLLFQGMDLVVYFFTLGFLYPISAISFLKGAFDKEKEIWVGVGFYVGLVSWILILIMSEGNLLSRAVYLQDQINILVYLLIPYRPNDPIILYFSLYGLNLLPIFYEAGITWRIIGILSIVLGILFIITKYKEVERR